MTNNISSSWEPLAEWLRCNGRQAFNTETGGGNVASCVQYLCEQIAYQAQNSDGTYASCFAAVSPSAKFVNFVVFLGYIGWAAGSFSPSSTFRECL